MYKILYNPATGAPQCVFSASIGSIPLDALNSDFRDFLEWNAQQTPPLDYTTQNTDAIAWAMNADNDFIFGGDDMATISFRGAPNGTAAFTVNSVAQTLALDAAGNGAITLDGDLPRGVVLVVGSGKLAWQSLKLFVV